MVTFHTAWPTTVDGGQPCISFITSIIPEFPLYSHYTSQYCVSLNYTTLPVLSTALQSLPQGNRASFQKIGGGITSILSSLVEVIIPLYIHSSILPSIFSACWCSTKVLNGRITFGFPQQIMLAKPASSFYMALQLIDSFSWFFLFFTLVLWSLWWGIKYVVYHTVPQEG